MKTVETEMYKAGWDDFMNVNGDCNFPNDSEYLEGWQDAEEALFEIKMEAELEMSVESYFD
jgi:hypothetical protein